MAALILFGGSTACNEKNNPTGPNTPSDGEEEELPEFDDNGNRYVDLVTENESGELVYNGLDTFIKITAITPRSATCIPIRRSFSRTGRRRRTS